MIGAWRLVALLLSMTAATPILAQEDPATEPAPFTAPVDDTNYLARIGFNDPKQVSEALMRVEDLYELDAELGLSNPVAIVVHGPEVSIFQKENYEDYKEIVDLAARLTALGVLDINVCERRLNYSGASKESVYPFVDTIPFGPREVNRLLDEDGYVYF